MSISFNLAEKWFAAYLVEVYAALLVEAVGDELFALVVRTRFVADLQLVEHEELLPRLPVVGLVLREGLAVEAQKVRQYTQAPQGNGVLVRVFLGREVEVVVLVEDVLEVMEEDLVEGYIAHLQLPLLVEVQVLRQDDDVVVLQLRVYLLDALYADPHDVTHDVQLLLARSQLQSVEEGGEGEGGVVALIEQQDLIVLQDYVGQGNEDSRFLGEDVVVGVQFLARRDGLQQFIMDFDSLVVRSSGIVLDALDPYLMALLKIDCQYLFNLGVGALDHAQGLHLADQGLFLEGVEPFTGNDCYFLGVLSEEDVLVLFLFFFNFGHDYGEVVLLLLLHGLRQLQFFLVTEGHGLRVLDFLPRLVLRLLLPQLLDQRFILLQYFFGNDLPAFSVDVLQVFIVLDLLHVGLLEDVGQHCLLALLICLEDFLFLIILLLVLMQLPLKLSHCLLLLRDLLTGVLADEDLPFPIGCVASLLVAFWLFLRFRAHVGVQVGRVVVVYSGRLLSNGLLDDLGGCVEYSYDVGQFVGNGVRLWLTFFGNWRVKIPFLGEVGFVAELGVVLVLLGFVELSEEFEDVLQV